jgi:nitrate reductase NapE component
MANEPERPIEKLLRAAAKKRREEAGAPFELHSATRRLLQGEVTRQFAKPGLQRRWLAVLTAQLWPRLALGVAIVAALGVLVWVVLPGTRGEKSPALLARNQPAPEPAPVPEVVQPAPAASPPVAQAAAKAPQAQPNVATYRERVEPQTPSAAARPSAGPSQLATDTLRAPPANESVDKSLSAASRQSADRKKAAEAEVAAAGGTVAQPSAGAVNGVSGGRYGFAGASAPPGNAPTTPAMPPPVATTAAPANAVAADESAKLNDAASARRALAYKPQSEMASANQPSPAWGATGALANSPSASLDAKKNLGASQRFTQVTQKLKAKAAPSQNAAAAHPVLAVFNVEQSGSALRIVDGDGSVYSGYVQIADTTRRSRGIQGEPPLGAAAVSAPKDAAAEKPVVRLGADHLLPQTYLFRVTGTNRSLQKKVVFTGSLLPAAQAKQPMVMHTNLGAVTSIDGFQAGMTQLLTVPLINTRISGKVVVGNAKAVEINAEPSSP